MAGRAVAPDRGAGRQAGLNAGGGVLDDQAAPGMNAHVRAAARYTSGCGLDRGRSWPLKIRSSKYGRMPAISICITTLALSAPDAQAIRPAVWRWAALTAPSAPSMARNSARRRSSRRA